MGTLILADIGNVSPSAPPGADKFETILGWTLWGAVIACVVGFIIAGAVLVYQRAQGGTSDAQAKLAWGMVGAVIIGISSTLVNTLAL